MKKGQQINTSRRFPTPPRSSSFCFRDMASQSSIKILVYPRRLPRRHRSILSLRNNERINPKIVEPIKLERVFRRIEICPEIVTGKFGDTRDDPRARATGGADH